MAKTHSGSMAQHDLGRKFFNGETSGKASNVQIVETEDETLLVGYSWAVYAARDKETGEITYYEDWYSESQSTKCQLSKLGVRAKADEIVDERRIHRV